MKKVIINNERALLELLNYKLLNGQTDGISLEKYIEFINLLKFNINRNKQYEEKDAVYIEKSYDEIFLDTRKYLIDNNICPDIYFEDKNIKVGYGLVDMNKQISSLFNGYMEDIVKGTLKNNIKINYTKNNDALKINNISATVCSIIIDNVINNYINSQVKLGNWPINCTDIEEYVLKRNIGPLISRKLTRNIYLDLCVNALKSVNQKLEVNDDMLFFSNNSSNLLAYANYIDLFNLQELEFLKKYIYNSNSVGDTEINIGISNNKITLLESTLTHYDFFGNKNHELKVSFVDNSSGDKIKKLVTNIK